MDNATPATDAATDTITGSSYLSPINALMDKYERILHQHRAENLDLYRIVQRKKDNATTTLPHEVASENNTQNTNDVATETETKPLFPTELRGDQLRARIQESHREIRQRILTLDADILPRTQAQNRKSHTSTVAEERAFRSDIVAA